VPTDVSEDSYPRPISNADVYQFGATIDQLA
jgi:hypothetical protein